MSTYVLKRFLLKVALIVCFAAVQIPTPWGFAKALLALAMLSALMSAGLALYGREPLSIRVLNYWDEAVMFMAIAMGARLLG